MKKRFFETVKSAMGKATAAVTSAAAAWSVTPVTVYAAGGDYMAPLTNLKTILLALLGAAGIIFLIYGIYRFAISFQKSDQNGEHQAVASIIAGAVMAGASAVLSALGV